MRKLVDLVKDILSLNNTDMEAVAKALATYDLKKAERLEFFLSVYVREEGELRAKWNNEIEKRKAA